MSHTIFHEVAGNVHLHTAHSDGYGSHADVARAARQAGLDFVIPTDHNVLVAEEEGWREGVLMLVGEETNDPDPPHGNHYLCFGIEQDVAGFADDAQAVIDAVNGQGGFGFIAHPCERPGPFVNERTYDWTRWDVSGYAGISIWNYMSEFKSYLKNLPASLLAVLFPKWVIRGPFPETLARYDGLLAAGQPVPLVGTSDAHANIYSAGPLRLQVFPYRTLFETVNLHLLLDEPLSGELDQARAQVYGAMRAGRGFVGYHALGDPRGFTFEAKSRNGRRLATYGQVCERVDGMSLEIRSPRRARLRLLREGVVIAETRGRRLIVPIDEAGVYRVEAHRWNRCMYRGWVYTNPIYVRET
jgi:hypothetical protein